MTWGGDVPSSARYTDFHFANTLIWSKTHPVSARVRSTVQKQIFSRHREVFSIDYECSVKRSVQKL